MALSRRDLLLRAAALSAAPSLGALPAQAASGPFQASWESLVSRYRAPAWYGEAKFGIWAHWTAQCVPEMGDWYARQMYIQGNPDYDDHLKRYGHPSKSGFMEIDNLWKAERWEPEKLLTLYERAGAKYFVALANHHDNFDAFDSRYHNWNSVKVGPKRDIVGTWEKLVRERGLRFGVSNHSAHAWHWFQVAYGYDAVGPLAGVRYDAYRLTKADGKGTWWEGLDPQELYTGRNMVIPDGVDSIAAMNAWHDAHDRVWTEDPPAMNPAFTPSWLLRCKDLMDKYRPDYVYFDDTGLPLGQAGLDATAHFYNANMQWHGGALEAVVTGKLLPPEHLPGLVEDVERGFSAGIRPAPWQTDTCIGDWHYKRSLFEEHKYKTAESVIQRLCDTVSKNGNLLLNIPLRGDGSIDSDEHAILEALAAWMADNGEAIFATRPWTIYGEGPTKVDAVMFGEQHTKPFTPADIRFTTKGETLYAQVLGVPADGKVTIASLGDGATVTKGKVERVEMLGAAGPLAVAHGQAGLSVTLPAPPKAGFVPVLKINGTGLVGAV
ncbi:MAG: alpha-L-fucosidase [Alphaproteobacteria bacterium]|nr:alpha-L-fucosidase [Alphaproteobacteria bacterium]